MARYVNTPIPEPFPPGPWVDKERCICGDHRADYRSYNSHVTFEQAAERLRDENQLAEIGEDPQLEFRSAITGGDPHDEAPGGYRSRGPVLWVMHVMKLERWYQDHEHCPEGDWDWDEFCKKNDGAPSCAGYWEWVAKEEDDDDEDDWEDDYDEEIGF